MPRAGKMKECSRRPRETDHVSTTCGEAHLATYGMSERLWVNVDYNVFMLAFVQLFKGSTVMR